MKAILNTLFEYKTLDKATAKQVLTELANGAYNNSQVAAFLTVFMMRSITVEELEGFREAMLALCVPLDIEKEDAIDLCGTGGDGKDTFNISTLASFIVAGSGQKVAKHGNNGVSSVCGSSNLLAHFGYSFTNNTDLLTQSIQEAGICFLHAPFFHPAMKNVAPIRKELGVKTFFNMLGPMVNPSFPKNQLVGVFNLELARLYGYLYKKLNKSFVVVHSLDGYDEISLTCPVKMISNAGETLLNPEDLGFQTIQQKDIYGGETVEEAADIFINVLKGKGTKAQNSVVIANAGMALNCTGKYGAIKESMQKAEESLFSGKALEAFENMISINKSNVLEA